MLNYFPERLNVIQSHHWHAPFLISQMKNKKCLVSILSSFIWFCLFNLFIIFRRCTMTSAKKRDCFFVRFSQNKKYIHFCGGILLNEWSWMKHKELGWCLMFLLALDRYTDICFYGVMALIFVSFMMKGKELIATDMLISFGMWIKRGILSFIQ